MECAMTMEPAQVYSYEHHIAVMALLPEDQYSGPMVYKNFHETLHLTD
jgi:hypothetical protein